MTTRNLAKNIMRTTRLDFNRFWKNYSSGNVNCLILSENCIKRLKQIVTDGSMLRITVDGGGCSGFIYKFELDHTSDKDDKIFEQDGVKVIVDSVSFTYIKGSTVDYEEQLIRSSFRIINNPIAEDGCSCGSSFSVKT